MSRRSVRSDPVRLLASGDSLPIDFGLATDTETLEASFRLVHDRYVARGYMEPHSSGRRLSLYHALPSTRVFVAKADGRVVGTVTLIEDSPIGLPLDEAYQAEMDEMRGNGLQVAEVSALALDSDVATEGLLTLMRLVRMVRLYAAECTTLDVVCIAVNPRHAAFYTRSVGFTQFAGVRDYPSVQGAPAVALRLESTAVRAAIAAAIATSTRLGELDEFFHGPQAYEEVMAMLARDLRQAFPTLEQFHHFFEGQEVLTQAPFSQRSFVESLYQDPETQRAHRDVVDEVLRRLELILGRALWLHPA